MGIRESDMPKVIEAAARAAHEVNRAYCVALGDDSQPPWEQAPEWQRKSAQAGAVGVIVNGNGPKESHASWLKQKTEDGWVYGETKNPDATPPTHPCMRPYEELPADQRKKDLLFVMTVKAIELALSGE